MHRGSFSCIVAFKMSQVFTQVHGGDQSPRPPWWIALLAQVPVPNLKSSPAVRKGRPM